MRGSTIAAVSCVVAVLAGCPSPTTVTPAEAPAPAFPGFGPEVLVHACGAGSTEDDAHRSARRALVAAVLGDPAWADVVALDLHRRGEDPLRTRAVDGGVEVALGLTRPRVAQAFSDFENAELTVHGPRIWREVLETYITAHVAAQACRQRSERFGTSCEIVPTDEADAAVAELGRGLELVSSYPDGVPVDDQGRALRAPVVFVLWRGVPVADLPVQVEGEPGAGVERLDVRSDAQGRARIGIEPGAVMVPRRVTVDADALLGPRRADAPQAAVRIEPRPVRSQRWAFVVTAAGRAAGKADAAARELRARMAASGRAEPVALAPRDVEALAGGSPEDRRARVVDIADAMAGSLDVLLVLAYRTRFASRMGGGRVWYEAEGTLRALDVWSGEVRAEATETIGANGVGDDAAAAAASRALTRALAARIIDAL